MLNHNTENGGSVVSHYFFDEKDNLFKIIAKRSYVAGDQVTYVV